MKRLLPPFLHQLCLLELIQIALVRELNEVVIVNYQSVLGITQSWVLVSRAVLLNTYPVFFPFRWSTRVTRSIEQCTKYSLTVTMTHVISSIFSAELATKIESSLIVLSLWVSDFFLFLFVSVVLLLAVVLLWKFCAFTLLPLLYPKEPKEIPYWTPCEFFLQHASRVPSVTSIESWLTLASVLGM